MQVSSYLEAFLSVYGWEMYYVLYLLFGSMGLFLYPFARIINDAYVTFLSSSEYASSNYMRHALASIILALIVFVLALIPWVSISFEETSVRSMCVNKQDVHTVNNSGNYFKNAETRVPILPWMAMSVGHGINSVIYSEGACVLDISDVKNATMNVNLSKAENPELLSDELNRFVNECHKNANDLMEKIIGGGYDSATEKPSEALTDALRDYQEQTGETQRVIMNNYDSPFIRDVFYSQGGVLSNYTSTKDIAPLLAKGPVEGINGYEAGSIQEGQSAAVPSCENWWIDGGTKPSLRNRITVALGDDVVSKMANDLGIEACQNDTTVYYRGSGERTRSMSGGRKQQCMNAIVSESFEGDQDKFYAHAIKSMQGNTVEGGLMSGNETAVTLGTGIAAIGATVIEAFIGTNVSAGIIGQFTSFYATLFFLKLLMKQLIPMVLMTIYMFWGFYLVIGRFSGETVIKGMLLIMSINMVPGLWAMVDHLDDKLFSAMYDGNLYGGGVTDRLVLDMATTMFQIAIIFILFYIVGEAGGGNGRAAIDPAQGGASKASSTMGSFSGSSASRAGRWLTTGNRNSAGQITSGGFGSKAAGFIKGGWGKIRGK